MLLLPTIVYAGGSPYIKSPSTKLNTWTSGAAYKCYAAAPTARGDRTYFYYRNIGTLTTNFISDSTRNLSIDLMEDDGLFGDDKVKTYTGYFNGRNLSSIKLTNTVIADNIEGSDDNCAELYMDLLIEKMSNDPNETVASGLFEYTVGTN